MTAVVIHMGLMEHATGVATWGLAKALAFAVLRDPQNALPDAPKTGEPQQRVAGHALQQQAASLDAQSKPANPLCTAKGIAQEAVDQLANHAIIMVGKS